MKPINAADAGTPVADRGKDEMTDAKRLQAGNRSGAGLSAAAVPFILAGTLVAVPGAQEARAQETSAQAALEEIVVTARRREESLQEIPVSVTAFSEASIDRNMFEGVADYFSRTPNVSFISKGSRDRKELSIRGVTNQLDSTEALIPANTFAFYIDEFSVSAATVNPAVMDFERIEILRGPQGTYFGRNAIGGAINITTRKPDNEFFAEGSFDVSRFDTYDLEGTFNIPLVEDVLAIRANYKREESDGFIDNVNSLGGGNDSEYEYARFSLRYTPTDRLTIDLIGTDSDEVVGMREGVPSGVMSRFAESIFGPGADPDGVGFWPENTDKVNFNRKQEVGSEYQYITGRVEYQFDRMSFTSISGYLESDTFLRGDIDGGSPDLFFEVKPISRESWSQEVRLQSLTDGAVDWTVGAIYTRDEGEIAQETFVGDAEPFGLPSGFQITASFGDEESTGRAVFGEAVWHATDKLDLLFGLRYTEDEITIAEFNVSAGMINNFVSDTADFDDVSPKVSATYFISDDTNVYATVSKGFKAGGVQIGSSLEESAFDPEELWNFEVGVKSQLFQGRARVNAALFYLDWTDLQASFAVAEVDDTGTVVFNTGIQNAASASNFGGEAEVSALLTDDLIANFALGYTDAEFDSFTNAFVDGEIVDLSGRQMPNAPQWTASADLEYGFPIAGRDGFARLEWFFRDESRSDLVALVREAEGFPFVVPSFNHYNLRVGVEGERFGVTAYVENLFDAEYFTNAFQKAFISGLAIEPSHQTYGIRLTLRTE